MSKGSHRRPENRAAIERNWPFDAAPCPECGTTTGLRALDAEECGTCAFTSAQLVGFATIRESVQRHVRTSDGWEERPGEPGKPQ